MLSDFCDHLPVFYVCPNSNDELVKFCGEAVFVGDKSTASMDKVMEDYLVRFK